MRFSMRPCQDDEDYWRIRAFLREVYLLNGRRELSWQTARLDYWRYLGNEHLEHYPLHEAVFLFETPDGCLAGVVTPESRGETYLNVHPRLRTAALEAAMLDTAEEYLAEPDADGRRIASVWASHDDELRRQVLTERGYVKGDEPEHQHRRNLLEQPPPDTAFPPGYSIRALGRDEVPARSWASWRAFHPDAPAGDYIGHDWYFSIQRCPLYRRDLDLVAVAADGELAAFTTVWYDDVTRTGYFEPVGTSPDHQRRGLARAIMYEGMRRLVRLGATQATVAGYSDAAVALYESMMTPDNLLEPWTRPV